MNGSIVSQHSSLNQAPPQSPSPSGRGVRGEGSRGDVWPWPFTRQRRYSVRKNYDPHERLLHAIAAQAIIDLVDPPALPVMTKRDRHSAFVYLCQHRDTLLSLNIPGHKLDFLAEWLEQREEVQP